MAEAWERQEGEDATAFKLFTTYRGLSPEHRSTRAVREAYEKKVTRTKSNTARVRGGKAPSLANIRTISKRWGWTARAAAWDDHRDSHYREAQLAEVREIAKRHAEQASQVTGQAFEAIALMRGQAKDAKDFSFLAGAICKLASALPKLQEAERAALGIGQKPAKPRLPVPNLALIELAPKERPCTPCQERRLYQHLAEGACRKDAALIAGLDPEAVELWMAEGADGQEPWHTFARNIERVEATAKLDLMKAARAGDPAALRFAPWLLERRHPDEFRLVDEDKLADLLDERDAGFESRVVKTLLRFIPEDRRKEAAEELDRAFRDPEEEDGEEE